MNTLFIECIFPAITGPDDTTQYVVSEEEISFSCTAYGASDLTISWQKDGADHTDNVDDNGGWADGSITRFDKINESKSALINQSVLLTGSI